MQMFYTNIMDFNICYANICILEQNHLIFVQKFSKFKWDLLSQKIKLTQHNIQIMTGSDDCAVTTCTQGCCNYYGNCPDSTSTSDYANRCWKYYEKGCTKVGSSDGDENESGQGNECEQGGGSTKGALIGGIIGGVAGLIILIIIIFCIVKKCRKTPREVANRNSSITLNQIQGPYHDPYGHYGGDQIKDGTTTQGGGHNASNQPYIYPGVLAPVK